MGATWTTADYALIVSLCSASLSLLSLGWNIWSKFIFPKPKLKVTFNLGIELEKQAGLDAIVLECVNFGPTEVIVTALVLRTKPRSKTRTSINYWSLVGSVRHVSGGRAIIDGRAWPRKLLIGESLDVILNPANLNEMFVKNPIGIGFKDSFDRFHLVPNKGFQAIRDRIETLK